MSISPSIGSTGGATPVVITGTGFQRAGYQSGVLVTLGDAVISPLYANSTTIWAEVPAHAPGQVDVVVTNWDGQTGRLSGAYTFALPESFDFNGNWQSDDHDGPPVRFTIQNDGLASVGCGTATTRTFSPPIPVSNGEFSFSGDDGVAFSGRIVSPSIARGTISMAPCIPMTWYAAKQ
ncbi:MAG TPA: IPT/TIG domain-containing protein [Vicinamibacterales bacterium]|nr:IPT/TIG domain-containing protein [Vicinamibacterales bacterium]